mgnify:CR=1 FL=1
MSYQKIYEALLAYEPKTLIAGAYQQDGLRCAIGVVLPSTRSYRTGHIETLFYEDEKVAQELRALDCTLDEAAMVQAQNDRYANEDPSTRYQRVLQYLKVKVEAEDTHRGSV